MEFNKKNIIMYSMLAVIALSFVLAVNYSKDKEENSSETGDINSVQQVVEKKEFFNINSTINNFYEYVVKENYEMLSSVLSSQYISDNSITKDNIRKFIIYDYDNINFYSKKIYFKKYNMKNYYFVTGEIQGYNFSDEILNEIENVNLLVIIDKNTKSYSVTPISSNYTIEEYAKRYKIEKIDEISQNKYNKYLEKNFTNEYIANFYLNYFNNILYLNNKKAYNMLTNGYKNNFKSYEIYKTKINEIDKELNAKRYSYNSNKTEQGTTYIVTTLNLKQITITESFPMSFTIDITNSNI